MFGLKSTKGHGFLRKTRRGLITGIYLVSTLLVSGTVLGESNVVLAAPNVNANEGIISDSEYETVVRKSYEWSSLVDKVHRLQSKGVSVLQDEPELLPGEVVNNNARQKGSVGLPAEDYYLRHFDKDRNSDLAQIERVIGDRDKLETAKNFYKNLDAKRVFEEFVYFMTLSDSVTTKENPISNIQTNNSNVRFVNLDSSSNGFDGTSDFFDAPTTNEPRRLDASNSIYEMKNAYAVEYKDGDGISYDLKINSESRLSRILGVDKIHVTKTYTNKLNDGVRRFDMIMGQMGTWGGVFDQSPETNSGSSKMSDDLKISVTYDFYNAAGEKLNLLDFYSKFINHYVFGGQEVLRSSDFSASDFAAKSVDSVMPNNGFSLIKRTLYSSSNGSDLVTTLYPSLTTRSDDRSFKHFNLKYHDFVPKVTYDGLPIEELSKPLTFHYHGFNYLDVRRQGRVIEKYVTEDGVELTNQKDSGLLNVDKRYHLSVKGELIYNGKAYMHTRIDSTSQISGGDVTVAKGVNEVRHIYTQKYTNTRQPETTTTVLKHGTKYVEDKERNRGDKDIVTEGRDGSSSVTKRFEMNYLTGEVTEVTDAPVVDAPVDTIIKVAAKDKVVTEEIESPKRYVGDEEQDYGSQPKETPGTKGSRTTTTVYTVNPKTGDVTENSTTVTKDPTETVVKVGTKPKVVKTKDNEGRTVITKTTYLVNEKTGDVESVDHVTYENNKDSKVVTETIPSPRRYEKDLEREKGAEDIVVTGKDGKKVTTTTYKVNEQTGEITETVGEPVLTEPTETVVKVAAKNKVVTEDIESPKRYVGDEEQDYGSESKETPGQKGTRTTTTVYTVNPKTGDVTEETTTTVKDPTETVVKVGAKPTVVKTKDNEGRTVITKTTYTVDPKTGKVTPTVTVTYENNKDSKVVTETIPSPRRYEKDPEREKGAEDIVVTGKDGKKVTTTTYEVNEQTGEITETVGEPVVTEPTETVVKVAAKDKVVTEEIESPKRYVGDEEQDYGSESKETPGQKGTRTTTTVYTVNPKTGDVTEETTTTVKDPTETVVKVGTKPMVVKTKDNEGRTVVTKTTYTVDPKTGNVTSTVTVTYENNKDSKVVTETIPSPRRYEKDPEREKGAEDIVVAGKGGKKVTTTTYKVNEQTGEITEIIGEPVLTEPTETVVKVAAKDKVVTEEIQPSVVYERDDARDYGTPNEEVKGELGKKVTTTEYSVNEKTGDVTEIAKDPVVTPAGITRIKVGTKKRVEMIRKGGNVIEKTTEYELDPKTGVVTEKVTEKLLSSNRNAPAPVLDVPEYNGVLSGNGLDGDGNQITPPVLDIPEYTGVLSSNGVDENGNVIEPPVLQIPDFSGGVVPNESVLTDVPEYTGPISMNGEPEVHEKPEYNIPEEQPKVETPKKDLQVVPQKQLPNTGDASVFVSASGVVLMGIGALARPKRKK